MPRNRDAGIEDAGACAERARRLAARLAAKLTFLVDELGFPHAAGGFFGPNFVFDPVAVPEPGTAALFGLGLCGVAMLRRRKA